MYERSCSVGSLTRPSGDAPNQGKEGLIEVLAIEFVLLAIDFVPLANEFVLLANQFVPLAIEFVALA